MQGASGGAGHNQGVKAPLPGVVDNFRAGAAPQQFGADCPAGQQGGEGFQLLGGLAGHPVPGELAVDVHLVGQDHQKGDLCVLGAVGLLDHVDGAQAAGTSVNGQEHVFMEFDLLSRWVGTMVEKGKGGGLSPFVDR